MIAVITIFGVILFGLFASIICCRIKLFSIEQAFQKDHPNLISADQGFKGIFILFLWFLPVKYLQNNFQGYNEIAKRINRGLLFFVLTAILYFATIIAMSFMV